MEKIFMVDLKEVTYVSIGELGQLQFDSKNKQLKEAMPLRRLLTVDFLVKVLKQRELA